MTRRYVSVTGERNRRNGPFLRVRSRARVVTLLDIYSQLVSVTNPSRGFVTPLLAEVELARVTPAHATRVTPQQLAA